MVSWHLWKLSLLIDQAPKGKYSSGQDLWSSHCPEHVSHGTICRQEPLEYLECFCQSAAVPLSLGLYPMDPLSETVTKVFHSSEINLAVNQRRSFLFTQNPGRMLSRRGDRFQFFVPSHTEWIWIYVWHSHCSDPGSRQKDILKKIPLLWSDQLCIKHFNGYGSPVCYH